MIFNGASRAVSTIKTKTKIKEEFERSRIATVFRTDSFGFPEPLTLWWHLGE
jgi:hypothetical protein